MNENWQRALGQMVTGLYILTTQHKEALNAMVVSWATQISYEPPMIMVAVHPYRYSHQLIDKSKHFALHVIDQTQVELIDHMMAPNPESKLAYLDWEPGDTDCPILKKCLAWFECRVKAQYQPGNHTLFIGEVVNASYVSTGLPLCSYDYEGIYIGRK